MLGLGVEILLLELFTRVCWYPYVGGMTSPSRVDPAASDPSLLLTFALILTTILSMGALNSFALVPVWSNSLGTRPSSLICR